MIREEFKQKLERRHTKLVLIWLAFFLFDFYYVGVAHYLAANDPVVIAPGFASKLRTALWLFAAANIWTLYGFWKKRIFTREAFLAPPGTAKILPALRDHASPVEQKAAAAVSSYFFAEVGTFAFAVSIALLGFVLAFLGRFMTDQYLLTLLSLAILAYEFPAKSFLRALVGEIEIRAELTGNES
jgi:hypothetical protein